MVIFLQRLRLVCAAVLAVSLLCQCETKRTYGEIKRSTISFDQSMWGGQGASDEKEIRSKFAEKGYSIGDDGQIVADKPNLYSDQKARGVDGGFDKKEAKFKKSEARTKEFRTPEYIKRQQYSGVESARESQSVAREGNFGQSRDRDANRLFQRKTKSSTELASFDTGTYQDANRTFSTASDSEGSRAIENAPIADGIRQTQGYRDNAALSVDDVKKMLNPGYYSRLKGLE